MQASGLPALVAEDGGPHEIMDHNLTGLVLPGTDVMRQPGDSGSIG